jgi:hypothetical protein
MAVGRPIVAYSLKSVQNVLKDYPLKVLVEPNNPERLAEGIVTALRDYKDERIDGRTYVEPYDWANIAKKNHRMLLPSKTMKLILLGYQSPSLLEIMKTSINQYDASIKL